ncbi:DsbA family protein [Kordiimonas aquimaris]|uniref:DsbA family protein n=1 Tax=Kordiimonas aquimaris TaxID=707591 RepID=UPI0021D1BC1F|nr:DsbA family protein [Kordiimonas aquimaris]
MSYQNYFQSMKFAALAAVFAVLSACSGGDDAANNGSSDTGTLSADTGTEIPEGVSNAEGTWGDIVYGDPNAPVEIIEYASLTCPHCASFATQIFPKIKESYIDTGKVKFVYRNFIMNKYDMAASVVARCKSPEIAKRLMSVFFAQQNNWARSEDPAGALAALARRAGGISRTQFDRCVSDQDMQKHLVKMTQDGSTRYKVNATPTIILNGDKVDNYGLENLQTLIEAEQ